MIFLQRAMRFGSALRWISLYNTDVADDDVCTLVDAVGGSLESICLAGCRNIGNRAVRLSPRARANCGAHIVEWAACTGKCDCARLPQANARCVLG